MTNESQTRVSRFKADDQVVVTCPGVHRDKQGSVIEVIAPSAGDFVYRYVVRFRDGTLATLFGFELMTLES